MLTTLEVDLADMYNGKHVEVGTFYSESRTSLTPRLQVTVPRQILCDHCRGSGAMTDGDIKQCGTCGGRGMVIQRAQVFPGMFTNMQTT
jgi:DnaJ-related protein SCJ1